MNKNLFICHTQSQLILASGLALGRFKDDENLLILFVDFGITDELKERLDGTFSRTLYLQSIYPSEFNTAKAKLKWYPQDWKLIRQFLPSGISSVFLVCDHVLLEQKIIRKIWKDDKSARFSWLEDGITAYYQDSNIPGGLDSNFFTRLIRKIIFKYFLCIGFVYERDFWETGGSKMLKYVYTCYPDAVREPYRSHKKLVAITDEEYLIGLQAMYPKATLGIQPNTVILVIDKLDRYAFPDKVRASLDTYIKQSKAEGKTVICKFHPRETEIWDIFEDFPEIDKSVGIESAYVSLADMKDTITIVGVKSTGLMTAKKLGYNVVSLFPSCGEENENLVKFYEKLEIELVKP